MEVVVFGSRTRAVNSVSGGTGGSASMAALSARAGPMARSACLTGTLAFGSHWPELVVQLLRGSEDLAGKQGGFQELVGLLDHPLRRRPTMDVLSISKAPLTRSSTGMHCYPRAGSSLCQGRNLASGSRVASVFEVIGSFRWPPMMSQWVLVVRRGGFAMSPCLLAIASGR